MELSHFDEKSGVVTWSTSWGKWWQTVSEVHLDVDLPQGTRSKDLRVVFGADSLDICLKGETVIKGQLFSKIHPNESVWTIEDAKHLVLVLSKADYLHSEKIWEALFADLSFAPDPLTLHEMRKKIDLEKFQLENPGMDFSGAKLQKCYDKLPGV